MIVSLLFILFGIPGVRERNLRKRMMTLVLCVVGSIGVAFAQMGQYGLIGGLQQLPFRGLALILFCSMLHRICKMNDVEKLDELNGVRRFAPYTYAWLVVLAAFVIGIPGTGTFVGVLYAHMGYMYNYAGAIGIVGQIANIVGMIVICLVILPILREGFLFEKKEETMDTDEKSKKIKGLSRGWHILATLVVVVLIVLSVYHDAWSLVVTRIINAVM